VTRDDAVHTLREDLAVLHNDGAEGASRAIFEGRLRGKLDGTADEFLVFCS
jgi:hypothetical protein